MTERNLTSLTHSWPGSVGVIGLGRNSLDLIVADQSPETMRRFIYRGETAAGSPADLGGCDVGIRRPRALDGDVGQGWPARCAEHG